LSSTKKFIIRISAFLLLTLIILSCNQSPVGFDQLGRNLGEPVSNEFNYTASACYEKYVPNGASPNLILGKNQEYESRVLVLFPLEDSLLDSLTEVRLVLFTETQKSIPFNIYTISVEWQESGVTWVRTDSAGYWLNPGGDFSPTVIGNGTITADSTVISLNLNHIDSLVRNGHGIILIPQDTGFAFLYSSEATSSKQPKVVYQYAKKNRIFTGSADASIIDTVNLQLGRNDRWIGSGFAFHTYLKFNVDTIPEAATIATAELTLHPANSFILTDTSDTVEIGVHRLLAPYQEGITPNFYSGISAYAHFTSTDTVIQIDLKNLVQFWSLNQDSNFGFILNGYPEYSNIFRIELKTDLANRPQLKAGYFFPPEGRF
jgi:hypothetical protein